MKRDLARRVRGVLEAPAAVHVLRVELAVVAVKVWAKSSAFVKVTVSPTFTVSSAGLKATFWAVTVPNPPLVPPAAGWVRSAGIP